MNATDKLTEIEAIKRLKYRYMRGIDEKLWEQIEACFVPKATCAYSNGKYKFDGRDAIMKFLTESMGRPTFLSSHRVHQPEIDLTSDTTADGHLGTRGHRDRRAVRDHDPGRAFYRDEYVKVGGEWKIKHTGYKRTYEQMQPRKGHRLERSRSAGSSHPRSRSTFGAGGSHLSVGRGREPSSAGGPGQWSQVSEPTSALLLASGLVAQSRLDRGAHPITQRGS
jgi:hypothetical protein